MYPVVLLEVITSTHLPDHTVHQPPSVSHLSITRRQKARKDVQVTDPTLKRLTAKVKG